MMATRNATGVVGVVLGVALMAPLAGRAQSPVAGSAGEEPTGIQVPPPPFTEGIFPCSECHKDLPVNVQRRKLVDMHDDIVLNHGPKTRWCFDCHNPGDRDKLRLASGELIEFTQSYRLCGQCHGDKLRDWKVGVHGKRTGSWNGKKQYLLCAHCHNPHSPRFKALEPLPPPIRPDLIGGKKGGTR